jgi:hypothetical protein
MMYVVLLVVPVTAGYKYIAVQIVEREREGNIEIV